MMRDLFDDDVQVMPVTCAECGVGLEIARSALSLFDSENDVLCVECMVRVGDSPKRRTTTLEQRVALIDDVVQDFGVRLRNVLLRSVRPDLSWNNEYSFEDWSDPADSTVAAHAPGIWYARRPVAARHDDE